MDIKCIEEIDSLNRIYYEFYIYQEKEIWLNEYKIQYRESNRHKWKNNYRYWRMDKRNSTIEREDVYIPTEIMVDLKKQLYKHIDELEITK